MRFVAVTIVLVAVSYVVAQNTPIILCGRQLANARVLLCYGSEFVNKRNSPPSYVLDNLAEDSREELDWPWNGRQGSLAASWTRFKRQGLADECCLKPCTTDVILNYC